MERLESGQLVRLYFFIVISRDQLPLTNYLGNGSTRHGRLYVMLSDARLVSLGNLGNLVNLRNLGSRP